jgi:hypothetical protein
MHAYQGPCAAYNLFLGWAIYCSFFGFRALLVRRGKRFRDYTHMSHNSRSTEERRMVEL